MNVLFKLKNILKKLILLLVLVLSLSISAEAQNGQTLKTYSRALFINVEGAESDWVEVSCRIYFNYGGDNDQIKMYLGEGVFNFTQISPVKELETGQGEPFYLLKLKDEETTEEIYLQYFKNEIYGIRFVDSDGRSMQFANPIE